MTRSDRAEVADVAEIAVRALRESRRHLPTREAVLRRQARLARRHLPWVAERSPWTRDRFRDAGLPLNRWHELPAVGKTEMMANFDRLNTVGVRLADALALARRAEQTRDFTPVLETPRGPVTVGLSTGTTGAQGCFVVDRSDRVAWASAILPALFRPFPRELLRGQRVAFFLRADGGLYRSASSSRLQIDFFDILQPVGRLAEQLTATQPTAIVGPPSVLLAVARAGGRARPKTVVSVAEVLEPDAEAALRGHFRTAVVQVYQATEGLLGLPCAAGRLHLTEAHVHVDLEPVGDGLVRPVVTDLRRRAQPMIRHRLTDLLRIDERRCPCGDASRVVQQVVGREDDALELPGRQGKVTVWPDFLRGALAAVPGLQEYRVVQTGPDALRLEIAPHDPATAEAAIEVVHAALTRSGVTPGSATLTTALWQRPPAGTKQRRVTRG